MLKVTIKRAQLAEMSRAYEQNDRKPYRISVEEAGVTDSAQPASWPGSFSVTDSDTMTLVVEERRSSRWRVDDTFLSQCCMKLSPSAPSYRSDTRSYQISSSSSFLVVGWAGVGGI